MSVFKGYKVLFNLKGWRLIAAERSLTLAGRHGGETKIKTSDQTLLEQWVPQASLATGPVTYHLISAP